MQCFCFLEYPGCATTIVILQCFPPTKHSCRLSSFQTSHLCGAFDLFTSHIYLPLSVSYKWVHTSFLLPYSFIYHNVFKVDLCTMSFSAFQSYNDILPHIYRMSPVSISQLMDIWPGITSDY